MMIGELRVGQKCDLIFDEQLGIGMWLKKWARLSLHMN